MTHSVSLILSEARRSRLSRSAAATVYAAEDDWPLIQNFGGAGYPREDRAMARALRPYESAEYRDPASSSPAGAADHDALFERQTSL